MRWRFRIKLSPQARRWVWIGSLVALVITILVWRIHELPSGISQPERDVLTSVTTVRIRDPAFVVDLPYRAVLKATLQLTDGSLLAARLLSVGLSAAGVVYFYRLSRQWWSRFIAGSAAILLGTSQWFLMTSRLIGAQSVSLLLTCALLLLFVHLKHNARWWQISGAGAIAGLAIYMSPLVGWLSLTLTVVALVYTIRVKRDRLLVGWLVYFGSFALALVPLIIAAIAEPSIARQVFGLDSINSLSAIGHESTILARSLIWDGSHAPLLLPSVGLLDWLTLAFILLGFLRSLSTWRLHRSQALLLVLGVAVAGVVLSSHDYIGFSFLLPISYLLCARGLNQYYSEWIKRFPRNMSAQLIGFTVILSLVSLISLYNLRAYYVAWSRSEVVQSQFEPYSSQQ